MVNTHYGAPGGGAMTVCTGIRCRNMCRRFALGRSAIMTTGTTPAKGTMVHLGGGPGNCSMAIITGIATGNMCRVFTLRRHTVMTSTT